MDVYTFDNTVKFNTVIYCLMRSYYLPEIPELPEQKDTWFAIPAVQHGPIINLAHSQIEYAALMMIDVNGRVVKAHRVNLHTPPILEGYELDKIKAEAFSVPMWEQLNQKTFLYDAMFDKDRMTRRFTSQGITRTSTVDGSSSNIVYNEIRQKLKPRPCTTCGGKK